MASQPILYFSSLTGQQGGAERRLLQLVREVRDAGRFRPLVVLPAAEGIAERYRAEGIPLCTFPFRRMRRTWNLLYHLGYCLDFIRSSIRLLGLIRREKVVLVHVNDVSELQGLLAATLVGIPAVAHVRYILEQPLAARLLAGLCYHGADHLVCISHAVRRAMFPAEARSQKISVLHDPVPDVSRHEPGNEALRREVRARLGIAPDAFVIGMISKFVDRKGHRNFVELAAELARLGFHDFRYLMVGGKVEGYEKYYDGIRAFIHRNGLDSSMVLTGYEHDITGMLEAMDVFVHLPDWEEALGAVVMEAMAVEKPVVAFDCGGIGELIADRQTGCLVPKGDIAAVASRIVELHSDPLRRRTMGRRAREALLREFSLGRYIQDVHKLYDSLLVGVRAQR